MICEVLCVNIFPKLQNIGHTDLGIFENFITCETSMTNRVGRRVGFRPQKKKQKKIKTQKWLQF